MNEGFCEAGIGEKMAQPGIDPAFLSRRPSGDFLGNLLERIEMAGGIAIPPGVVGDDGFAAAEELDQVGGRGHGGLKHGAAAAASR
jgi:hypothetical protein